MPISNFGELKLDGVGLFVDDMTTMVRFYRDVLGFEITEGENAVKGFNGHFEIALYVDTFEEVDEEYASWQESP